MSSKDWLGQMGKTEDEAGGNVSVGGMACDVGMIHVIPPDDLGIDPCAVERWIHRGQHVPNDATFVHNVKGLMDEWAYWRERGMDAVAVATRDRLAEIIESMKRIQ